MGRWLLGAVVWLGLGGVALAAPQGSLPSPAVVIQADQGQAAHMPTYRGPGGTPIPAGACGAVVNRRVWVLPCSDPRVVAYQKGAAATAVRTVRRWHGIEAGGIVLAAVLAGAAAEFVHRRRIR